MKKPNKARSENPAQQEELWLLGQPPLRKYLDFIEDSVVDTARANLPALTAEWSKANDYYFELEKREAGIADSVQLRKLDRKLAPLAESVAADPRFRRTFDPLPTSFGVVELDRLVLCQIHVTKTFVDELAGRLGPAPDPVALFNFCLPLQASDAPVRVRRMGSRRFVFQSDSRDFRFHESVALRPDQINGYEAFGHVAGAIGLMVGFSSNWLNVIRYGKRLLLHNGYHRACALRSLGITHAPCVIQTVTRVDELDIVAKENVADDPEFYFRSRRPPLLKDYFNPRIRKLLPIQKLTRSIEISFEVRDHLLPA